MVEGDRRALRPHRARRRAGRRLRALPRSRHRADRRRARPSRDVTACASTSCTGTVQRPRGRRARPRWHRQGRRGRPRHRLLASLSPGGAGRPRRRPAGVGRATVRGRRLAHRASRTCATGDAAALLWLAAGAVATSTTLAAAVERRSAQRPPPDRSGARAGPPKATWWRSPWSRAGRPARRCSPRRRWSPARSRAARDAARAPRRRRAAVAGRTASTDRASVGSRPAATRRRA